MKSHEKESIHPIALSLNISSPENENNNLRRYCIFLQEGKYCKWVV